MIGNRNAGSQQDHGIHFGWIRQQVLYRDRCTERMRNNTDSLMRLFQRAHFGIHRGHPVVTGRVGVLGGGFSKARQTQGMAGEASVSQSRRHFVVEMG